MILSDLKLTVLHSGLRAQSFPHNTSKPLVTKLTAIKQLHLPQEEVHSTRFRMLRECGWGGLGWNKKADGGQEEGTKAGRTRLWSGKQEVGGVWVDWARGGEGRGFLMSGLLRSYPPSWQQLFNCPRAESTHLCHRSVPPVGGNCSLT